ncbi:uncharacterized protein [Montipora capricornis]|uniref:uncharacterized protein isoform X1 n=1 Tax=Montipora capricornis TaxID=246305 RepID=UPI0035F13C3D
MSSFPETTPIVPTVGNSAPLEQPPNVSQEINVKEEAKEHLNSDVSSGIAPVGLNSTTVGASNSTDPTKKVDPRQQWINTDRTKPYYCKLCDFNMETMEFFQHHCMSPRHVKRAIEEFRIKLPKRLEEKEEKKPPPEFNCQVCLVTCNSDTAWNSHLLGQKHRKALEKQGAERAQQKAQEKSFTMNSLNTSYTYNQGAGRGLRGRGGGVGPVRGGGYTPGHTRKPYDKPMHAVQQPSPSGPIGAKDFATYPEPLIGLEYVTEIQVIGQSPRYHCQLCDSKFDHNLKFPHLVGSKHRFNVLKEKVPEVAGHIRGDVKKRSELSSKLLEEAHKLEMMEGRQQVKTRVEKSPFNVINNQAAARGGMTTNTSRRGGQQWQTKFGGGQGGGRGGQVATRGGTQGFTRGGAQNSVRGGAQSSVRGGAQSSVRGGAQGSVRGGAQGSVRGGWRGRGNQQATSFNHQQQSGFNRGGRGRARGRGTGGSNSNQVWNQGLSFSGEKKQPYASTPFGSMDDSFPWEDGNHAAEEPMLPPEAFKPRSPPRSQNQQQFGQYDEYYDDYYGKGKQNTSFHGANFEYNESFSNPTTYTNPNPSGPGFHSQNQLATASHQGGNTMTSGGAGNNSVSLLQGAIADLGKLVSNEEDASVALQVSNALTQALLQFRMNNLPQVNDTNAGTAADMDTSS